MITPKEDGQIDPVQLLKATYDSGVSAAEMDVTARGKIVKDSSGGLALQVEPNRSFALVPNELSKGLDSLVGSQTIVTVRGQLYKKPPGKKQKVDTSVTFETSDSGSGEKRIDARQMVAVEPADSRTRWM